MTEDIKKKVKEIIVEKLGVDENEVTDEASFNLSCSSKKSSTSLFPTIRQKKSQPLAKLSNTSKTNKNKLFLWN